MAELNGDRPVLLLTGASGTLGTALGIAFRSRFDIVAVRRHRQLRFTSQLRAFVDPLDPGAALKENEHPAHEIVADLSQAREISRVCEVALARFGRVDVVVNAIGSPAPQPLLLGGLGTARAAFENNALVPMRLVAALTERAWRHQQAENKARSRCVVNLGAASTLDLDPARGSAAYSAAKSALTVLTGHLAHELAPFSVRANLVAPAPFPSPVQTDRVVHAVDQMITGDETGRVLVVWSDGDELI